LTVNGSFLKTTTAADYEKVMQTATEALKHSRQCQRHNVGKLRQFEKMRKKVRSK
jgi:uncharacterized protein YdeI (YjbR/CyaY-like superfamily)